MSQDRNYKSITQLARDLRNNPTPSEKLFWESVRKRRFKGLRFLRQFPIVHEERGRKKYFYIADFYCAEKKLVIEIDGKIHDFQKQEDFNRDFVLNQLGITVIRIKNEELVNMDLALEKISTVFKER